VGISVGAGVYIGAGRVELADVVAVGVVVGRTVAVDETMRVGESVGDVVAEATRVEVTIISVAGALPALAALATISPAN